MTFVVDLGSSLAQAFGEWRRFALLHALAYIDRGTSVHFRSYTGVGPSVLAGAPSCQERVVQS